MTVAIISKYHLDYRWSADVERTSVGQGELVVVIVNAVTGVAADYHHRGRALPHGYVCVCVRACARARVRGYVVVSCVCLFLLLL